MGSAASPAAESSLESSALTSSGILFTLLVLVAVALVGVVFLAVIRHTPRAQSSLALADAEYEAAVAIAENGIRADLVPASIAARHLGDLGRANELAERAVRGDPNDGEAWLELGLARAYAGNLAASDEALRAAFDKRSDLAEAVGLHRAWVALRGGHQETARTLFDEVEAPMETKLRHDLGAGDPVFADWFFQAGELWLAAGDRERGEWALREARRSAPESRLFDP